MSARGPCTALPEDTPSTFQHLLNNRNPAANRGNPPFLVTSCDPTASTRSLHSLAIELGDCERIARLRMDPKVLGCQGPGESRRKTAAPENENGGPLTLARCTSWGSIDTTIV